MAALWVMVGGALGALLRFQIGQFLDSPWLVLLLVNLGGSALAGCVSAGGLGVAPLVSVGFLGALTTFSAFSAQAFYFLELGRFVSFLLFAFGGTAGGVLCFALGYVLCRSV